MNTSRDVERARGFVTEQYRRTLGYGASDGNALLFATGQLSGKVMKARAESDEPERFARRHDLPVRRDRWGNLYVAYHKGEAEPIAFTAHMDHPGFEVLDGGTRPRAQFLGGVAAENMAGTPVLCYPQDAENASSASPPEPVPGRIVRTTTQPVQGRRPDADLESAAWVVVSEVAWRGWRAESAGRELPLVIADHAFLGLHLPAGVHQVELFYRPRSFEIGLGITAVISLITSGTLFLAFSPPSAYLESVRRRAVAAA